MNNPNLTRTESEIVRFITSHRVQTQQSPTISEVLEFAEVICDDCNQASELINGMNHEGILNVRPRSLAVTVGQLS